MICQKKIMAVFFLTDENPSENLLKIYFLIDFIKFLDRIAH